MSHSEASNDHKAIWSDLERSGTAHCSHIKIPHYRSLVTQRKLCPNDPINPSHPVHFMATSTEVIGVLEFSKNYTLFLFFKRYFS